MAREVGHAAGLPVAFVTVGEELRNGFDTGGTGCPILWIKRRMLPPWKLKSMTDRAERVLGRDTALGQGGGGDR